jgi:solute:Na+ symporter, SSS family
MIQAAVVFVYLGIVLYIGIFAFRKGKDTKEDFFLANRSIGPVVFLLSLFGTNMTAVAILGSSGKAYREGIGVYGLMASSSGFVIPLTIFFIGTRVWGLGKRFGHMTQVAYFRDRWECSAIGTVIFALTAIMLVPYIIIGVMGGGTTLERISNGAIPYWFGGAVVAIVVMGYVFFGGMRGTAWVNTFQTVLFLCFGAVAFVLISRSLDGGFSETVSRIAADAKTQYLLTREKMPKTVFISYMLIPLSAIMFPHISIMCLTAEKVTSFKKTVIFYPLCIMAIWLPSVFLGVMAQQDPTIHYANLKDADGVMLDMLNNHAPTVLAGILGAGIMAAVMASDSQILALCTMFTEDLFAYYGGRKRFGEKTTVWVGRGFIVLITLCAYLIALLKPEAIFELAITYAFSGFAALSPIMIGALFWRRSTKYGALAATLWVAGSLAVFATIIHQTGHMKPGTPIWTVLGQHLITRSPTGISIYGFMIVVPMVFGSAFWMVIGSLLTRPPSQATVDKYFPAKAKLAAVPAESMTVAEGAR